MENICGSISESHKKYFKIYFLKVVYLLSVSEHLSKWKSRHQNRKQDYDSWKFPLSSRLKCVFPCRAGRSSTSCVKLDAFVYCVLSALCNILSIIQSCVFCKHSSITQDALSSSNMTLKRTDLAANWLSGDVTAHLALSQAQMLFRRQLWLLWQLLASVLNSVRIEANVSPCSAA